VAGEGVDAVSEDAQVAFADGAAGAGEQLERPRVGGGDGERGTVALVGVVDVIPR